LLNLALINGIAKSALDVGKYCMTLIEFAYSAGRDAASRLSREEQRSMGQYMTPPAKVGTFVFLNLQQAQEFSQPLRFKNSLLLQSRLNALNY